MNTTEENERKELCRRIKEGDCGAPYLQGYLSIMVLSHSIPIAEARNIAEAVKRAVEFRERSK